MLFYMSLTCNRSMNLTPKPRSPALVALTDSDVSLSARLVAVFCVLTKEHTGSTPTVPQICDGLMWDKTAVQSFVEELLSAGYLQGEPTDFRVSNKMKQNKVSRLAQLAPVVEDEDAPPRPILAVLSHYTAIYKKRFRAKPTIPSNAYSMLRRLLKQYSFKSVDQCLDPFFNSKPSSFDPGTELSIEQFCKFACSKL
jgi:hypothetical protein